MSTKTTIQLSRKTRDRLESLGKKGESFDKIVDDHLSEARHIPKIKEVLSRTIARVERNKKQGLLDLTVADDLIRTIQNFIKDIEAR